MDPRTPGEIEATGTLPVAGEGAVPLTSSTEPVSPTRPDWIDEARATLTVPGKYLAYEDSGRRIVVPVSRLAPGFLDLSTRLAGEVFQKMEQYSRRLVIQGDIAARVAASKALHDFVYETNRRGHHLFVPDHASLIARLG